MKRSVQKAAAFVSALVLLGGALPSGETVRSWGMDAVSLTASAEEQKTVTLNETTGLVTIRGNVDASAVKSLSKKTVVKKVVAEKGAVLPESCQGLFLGYCAESIDLSNADSSHVTNTVGMFDSCKDLTELNLSGFDTSHVTDMNSMFAGCAKLTSLDVTGFDTSNVTAMGSMFSGCASLTELDVSGFKTPKVTKLSRMFQKCAALKTLNLAGFETAQVTEMASMFAGCTALKTIRTSTLFVTDGLESANAGSDVFDGCTNLVGSNQTLYRSEHRNYVYARIDSFEEPGYFTAVLGMLPSDEFKDVVFDEETGTLTLSGKVNYTHVALYRENENVKKVVAEKGTILPPDCNDLFMQIMAEEIDLSKADTSNVTNMQGLFEGCVNLTAVDLSGFKTSNVINMRDMFYRCEKLAAVDVSMFDTAKCESFYGMFRGCKALTALDLSNFNTAKADALNEMFRDCTSLTELDLSNFDTSFASYFSGMFGGCESLASLNISSFRTPRAVNLSYMFYNCKSLTALDLTKFDTAHVEKMDGMFLDCSGLTELDLRSFSQRKYCDMSKLFGGCANLEKILVSDSWNYSQLTALTDGQQNVYRSCYMFSGCEKLTGGSGTAFDTKQNSLSMFRIDSAETPGYLTLGDDSVQPPELKFGAKLNEETGVLTIFGDFSEYGTGTLKNTSFNNDIKEYKNDEAVKSVVAAEGTILPVNCSALFSGFMAETIDLTKADASHVENMFYMFQDCVNLKSVNLSGMDFSSAQDASNMFSADTALESLDLTGVRCKNLQKMQATFTHCTVLKEIKGSSEIGTSKIRDLSHAFAYCKALTEIDLSELDLSSAEDMSSMLCGCEGLQSISLSGLKFPKLKTLNGFCSYNPNLTSVDFSGLEAPNLGSLDSLCVSCPALKSVNLSGIKADELKNMSYAFQKCTALTDVNFSGLNTSGVWNMSSMFSSCSSLQTLDLSSFDTSSLTSAGTMFNGCQNLRTVYVSDKWDNSQITEKNTSMFMNCVSIVGGNGTVYSKDHMDGEYARIDTADAPGYLTAKGAALPPVTETTVTTTATKPVTTTVTSTTPKPVTTTVTSTTPKPVTTTVSFTTTLPITTTLVTTHADYAPKLTWDQSPMKVGETRRMHVEDPYLGKPIEHASVNGGSDILSWTFDEEKSDLVITAKKQCSQTMLTVTASGCAFTGPFYVTIEADETTASVTTTAVTTTTTAAGTEPGFLLGDVNLDGTVSVEDAQLTLSAYVLEMSGMQSDLSELQRKAADVNTDQSVSVEDAQTILLYYVENTISGNPTTWDDLLRKDAPAKTLPHKAAARLLRIVSMIGF